MSEDEYRFVEVELVVEAFVVKKFVLVALPAMSEDEYRFVEVELVAVSSVMVVVARSVAPEAVTFVATTAPSKRLPLMREFVMSASPLVPPVMVEFSISTLARWCIALV